MYYNWKNSINTEELKNVSNLIRNGEIIVFPTETVYGIGADALNPEAALKIFEAKQRPVDNPLIVHVANENEIGKVAEVTSAVEQMLIDNFMPGPITIILKKKKIIPDVVSAGLDTIGVRMPSNEIAHKIIEDAGVPIAAPSANVSGRPSGTNLLDIRDELEEKVSVVIDGGNCQIGLESTVVKVMDGVPVILRPGKVTPEEIKKVVGKVQIDSKVFEKVLENEKVESPGMKYRHYAPKTKCKLIYSEEEEKQIKIIKRIIKENKNIVVLCFKEHIKEFSENSVKFIDIGSKDNLNEFAKNVYSDLRAADRENADLILIEGVESKRIRYCNYE